MGAKQSKRSVDISGKEAESAGEVAAAGAGGEGRVEPLADADALKPHLNGDAHIHEQTDKEKQLDSGTPENEKDATTEKEGKQEESEQEKEATPVTNGDSAESKTENGDTAPTPEETKKPKKEKVKKKWSLRSISFSRKDKPKQEKKQKEEEPKTNGEPEKVPEEASEVTAEPASNDVAEVKAEIEIKEEKTPETPVTEPITNGSNTPESPKVEIPPAEEVIPEAVPEPAKTEKIVEPEPEKLPINGLSLEEPKNDEPEVAQTEESKPEETPAESTDTTPAIEIPVPKEVCVDQMPVIETTPPPLPANPPPSSVVSFAATTMAPDLTDASLVNTAETAISTPSVLDTKTNLPKESPLTDLTNKEADIPSPLTKPFEEIVQTPNDIVKENLEAPLKVEELVVSSEPINDGLDMKVIEVQSEVVNGVVSDHIENPIETEPHKLVEPIEPELPPPPPLDDNIEDIPEPIAEESTEHVEIKVASSNFSNGDMVNGIDNEILNGNTEIEQANVKNKTVDSLGNYVQTIECNGNIKEAETETKEESGREQCREESIAKAASLEESLPPSPSEGSGSGAGPCEAETSDSFPAPPSDLRSPSDGSPEPEPEPEPQEPIAVSDKIADLIPEVPVVPDLNTETLQETTDVAVAN